MGILICVDRFSLFFFSPQTFPPLPPLPPGSFEHETFFFMSHWFSGEGFFFFENLRVGSQMSGGGGFGGT